VYKPVDPKVDLPALEHAILDLWRERDVFHRSLQATAQGPTWVFYEGPPTANGAPGTHHVEARVFKDVFPRFKTMKGYHVPRKAGWDCHGLPVELAVERALGFTGKQDIEKYGVAEFNEKCRESVLQHVDEFQAMTERMAYWVDLDDAYWTMSPDYIESVWWSLKTVFDKGLLVQDHRVAPYCPRCGTGLSDHELAQGYETVVDPSVFVRFPVLESTLAQRYPGVALLVWTTTPWTLVANTAVAVQPNATYVVARTADDDTLVVVDVLADELLGEHEVLETISGRDLERIPYQRPFDLVAIGDDADGGAHYVVLADYVTTDDGTGLVHIAPAFGPDDLAAARTYGLPVINPVRGDGTFDPDVPLVGGMFFKKADDALVPDLKARGLLFRHVAYEHSYPHCWRCHTPLLYYAQPSWYIRTTAIKDALLRENATTNWFPDTIKWGRYGDWLNNNIDWAVSRSRYWGTPLPIWRCESDHLTAVGSLAELSALSGTDVSNLDPHRPYVDEVTLPCGECGELATRVPEVIDGWYDSGAMPFAQFGYPHRNVELFESRYPADFICEAIDQTRGWFYTLMAVGTLVFDQSSYRNVLCLGHILDDEGRKMSKHLGNVLEPISLMDSHGADALRWFMLAGGSPWQARRVGHATIQDVVRKTLLTYWNTVSFQSLYARASGFEPYLTPTPPVGQRPSLDRWALSEAHRLARDVDVALEEFDTQQAGRLLAEYVEDLSNWYVRRSRRRFWDGDPAALATLHECLHVVTLLMAPFTPFITEQVWQDMYVSTSGGATDSALPDSVHLAAWPSPDDAVIDDELRGQVELVRRLVELGRAARATSSIKTRQPLGRALVSAVGWRELPADLMAQVLDEVNVEEIAVLQGDAALVEISVKANFRSLGRRFATTTPSVAAAIGAADAATLVASLRADGGADLQVNDEPVHLEPEDVLITEAPRAGWAVASDHGETLALDLEITPALRARGLAREFVRLVQDARKRDGLDVTDRIALTWRAHNSDLGAALHEHRELIAREVLATAYAESLEGPFEHVDAELGCDFTLVRA